MEARIPCIRNKGSSKHDRLELGRLLCIQFHEAAGRCDIAIDQQSINITEDGVLG